MCSSRFQILGKYFVTVILFLFSYICYILLQERRVLYICMYVFRVMLVSTVIFGGEPDTIIDFLQELC